LEIIADDAGLANDVSFNKCISLCPLSNFPTRRSSEEYKVKIYHAPIKVFHNMGLPCLDIESCHSSASLMSAHHFYCQTSVAPDSSGGPVINMKGELIGIVVSGYIPKPELDIRCDDFPEMESTWSGMVSERGNIATYARVVIVANHRTLILILESA
jgi:hypothetical protein